MKYTITFENNEDGKVDVRTNFHQPDNKEDRAHLMAQWAADGIVEAVTDMELKKAARN